MRLNVWGARVNEDAMRKKNLHHQKIREINQELILLAQNLYTKTISGKFLVIFYEICHGIENHGFDENKHYDIYIKDNTYVLLTENTNVPTFNSRQL